MIRAAGSCFRRCFAASAGSRTSPCSSARAALSRLWNPGSRSSSAARSCADRDLLSPAAGGKGMNAPPPPPPTPFPVLLDDVVDALAPAPGETHVDGTFGAGGYTKALLAKGVARVFAFDRDPEAIQYGETLAASSGGRLTLVPERFSRMRQALADHDVDQRRRRHARYRRLLDAARPGRARLLLPGRRPARHAHGQGGAERRRLPQPCRRGRDRRRALPLWRGAQVAAGRPGDRRGAADRADRPARRRRPQGARPPSRA